MKKLLIFILLFMFFLSPLIVEGQQNISMADEFREDGKIWVVIAVFGTLLAGFFVYLFSIDKKLDRIEKSLKNNKNS